jgi:hypothetical protein
MKISIIGWGSLIWRPETLQIASRWRRDGPSLPIEFARISKDGRLTLVIYEESAEVQTYWASSGYNTLDAAIENLQERECTEKGWIHCLLSNGKVYEEDGILRSVPNRIRGKITAWLARKPELDAAAWTGLPSNWQRKRHKPFSVDDAVLYTEKLETAIELGTTEDERGKAEIVLNSAREYVRNTPAQVQTAVRKRLSAQRSWADTALSPVLFDPE